MSLENPWRKYQNRKLGSIENKVKLPKLKLPERQKIEKPRPSLPLNIVMTWFEVFLAMAIYTVGWFACGLFVFPFISAIQSSMTFDSQVNTVITFIKACFLYHPIIALLGWFIYGILQSFIKGRYSWQGG